MGFDNRAAPRLYRIMARTLIDIPREMLDALDAECARQSRDTMGRVARTALIRRIIREWLVGRIPRHNLAAQIETLGADSLLPEER